jgi:hypothetical protein
MSTGNEVTLTATETIVVDFRRFYKRPRRVYGDNPYAGSQLMRNGDTITFPDQQFLLRALAGQLTSKETFGTVLGL